MLLEKEERMQFEFRQKLAEKQSLIEILREKYAKVSDKNLQLTQQSDRFYQNEIEMSQKEIEFQKQQIKALQD